MERLHADIGSIQAALNQGPEVFQPVRVDFAANVLYRVVNHFMLKLVQAFVRFQRVSKQRGPGENVVADFRLQSLFLRVPDNLGTHLATALQDPHDGGFVLAAGAGNDVVPFRLVPVPCLAADEGLIRFDLAGEFIGDSQAQREPDGWSRNHADFWVIPMAG